MEMRTILLGAWLELYLAEVHLILSAKGQKRQNLTLGLFQHVHLPLGQIDLGKMIGTLPDLWEDEKTKSHSEIFANEVIMLAMLPMVFAIRKFKEWRNKGDYIRVPCRRCGAWGPHDFTKVDSGISDYLGIPLVPLLRKRIFTCGKCGVEMYEDGCRPTASFAQRFEAFMKQPEFQEAYEQLQQLVAQNQKIAVNHAKEIMRLQEMLADINADKAELIRKIRELIERIRREAA